MNIATISPQRLHELAHSGIAIELIDVRTPAEFGATHVGFAHNVPLDRFTPAQFVVERKGQPLYVICHSGNRAKQACEQLIAAGYSNVINVEGGTQAWVQAGLPVIRGRKAMSLERQVRIAAGSLVLAGTALGAFVSPYWLALSAFVGAGLVFAGITDTCGMGMLLARMPWNQVSQAPITNAAVGAKSCASNSATSCSS